MPPVRSYDKNSQSQILIDTLEKTTKVLEIQQLVQSVETGQYYREHKDYFKPSNTVDHYLLENLSELRDKIKQSGSDLDYPTIHAFLGRIIFTCYLVDRGIISSAHFSKAGARNVVSLKELFNSYDPPKAKTILYKLFKILQKIFNGSLFDEDIAEEESKILPEHIETLQRFLNMENLHKGQRSFEFEIYDFSIIPIETISAIYEEFLAAEDIEWQRKLGAYYTPKLLAELTVDIAVEGWDSLLDKKVLDPSCGSGIFLVILFNRMAEEWRLKNPNKRNITKARELVKIIQNNLCGVDVKETACRVTCFSLYLAFLDQLSPRDIDDLKEKYDKILPNLLALEKKNYKVKDKGRPVIIEGNFFDPKIPIATDFDLVIGNPPWIGRGQNSDKKAEDWCQSDSNPWLEKVSANKKDRELTFMPQDQIAHVFAWKAPLHLNSKGRGCKVLPSKLFLNRTDKRTDKFQNLWFREVSVDTVIQLSDMRFILFKNAICPAVITRFSSGRPKIENAQIDYQIPKVSRIDPRNGVVTLFPGDCKKIKLKDIFKYSRKGETSVLWKKLFWGTPRDVRLLDRLLCLPKLNEFVGEAREGKRWIKGQGFIPDSRSTSKSPKSPWWGPGHLFADARSKAINYVLLKKDCDEIKDRFRALHRIRDPRIFKGPLILINQGFSKFAFCEFDILFRDSLQSICGPKKDEDLLLFLNAVFNSKLATFYLFHTAANWGTERDKVHLFELLRLPFPFPEETSNPQKSALIIEKVANQIKRVGSRIEETILGKKEEVDALKRYVEPLIYDYYEISEWDQFLIEDTFQIFEPSSTPSTLTSNIPTVKPSTRGIRSNYVDCLCAVINNWAKRSDRRVSGAITYSSKSGLGILTLKNSTTSFPYKEKESPEHLQVALSRLKNFLPKKVGRISYFRGLKIFDQEEIHIIKPLEHRHWTKTAALNDADEIAAEILKTGR